MKLNENTKLTLTIGQIKRLIKEAAEDEEEIAAADDAAEEVEQDSLEDVLNSLLGDEFNAWKQYTMMVVAAKGKSLARVEEVFKNAGGEEMYDHFENLYKWMQSVGMKPMNDPDELDEACKCSYVKIEREQDTGSLIEIAIKAENAAIEAYEKALAMDVVKSYPDLVYLLSEFLKDERGHFRDLQDVQTQVNGFNSDAGETEVDDNDNEIGEVVMEERPAYTSIHHKPTHKMPSELTPGIHRTDTWKFDGIKADININLPDFGRDDDARWDDMTDDQIDDAVLAGVLDPDDADFYKGDRLGTHGRETSTPNATATQSSAQSFTDGDVKMGEPLVINREINLNAPSDYMDDVSAVADAIPSSVASVNERKKFRKGVREGTIDNALYDRLKKAGITSQQARDWMNADDAGKNDIIASMAPGFKYPDVTDRTSLDAALKTAVDQEINQKIDTPWGKMTFLVPSDARGGYEPHHLDMAMGRLADDEFALPDTPVPTNAIPTAAAPAATTSLASLPSGAFT